MAPGTRIRTVIGVVAVLLTTLAVSTLAPAIEEQGSGDPSKLIKDVTAQICEIIATTGRTSNPELQGQLDRRIKALTEKLAALGLFDPTSSFDTAEFARALRSQASSSPNCERQVSKYFYEKFIRPVPSPSPLPTVDDALASLRAANVAFSTPDEARVGTQFIVEAKLALHLSREELLVLVEELGKHEVRTLKISDRMAATLSGGSAFDVSPSGPKEQWISDNALTEWNWQVTPKVVGEQTLILSFDAIINLNGKDDNRTINTFKHHIKVDVGWPETVGEWLGVYKEDW